MASHFGGTMSATAIRYPKAIKAKGEWRRQFQNVTDIVPTILEVTGVPEPDYVNGQKKVEYPGKSLDLRLERCGCQNQSPDAVF
jgi:arylsulfatase A-like enzyme